MIDGDKKVVSKQPFASFLKVNSLQSWEYYAKIALILSLEMNYSIVINKCFWPFSKGTVGKLGSKMQLFWFFGKKCFLVLNLWFTDFHMSRGDFIHLMIKFRMLVTVYKSLEAIMAVFVLWWGPKHAKHRLFWNIFFDFKAITLSDSSFLRTICN